MDISELALRAQEAWFRGLAAAGFPQISAGDGFAVSTGVESNTENGAVIAPSVLETTHTLDTLLVWLREKAVPASVLVTGPLEPEATARLIERGLEPELTGDDMGRLLAGFDLDAAGLSVPGCQISEVTDAHALRQNHRVYADDDWWDDTGELEHRVEVATRLGFDLAPVHPNRWADALGADIICWLVRFGSFLVERLSEKPDREGFLAAAADIRDASAESRSIEQVGGNRLPRVYGQQDCGQARKSALRNDEFHRAPC